LKVKYIEKYRLIDNELLTTCVRVGDVTKNSTEIVGTNHTLMLRLTSTGAAADAVTSASFTRAAGPPPSHPVWRQPTPPPAVTSANFGTPPPPMMTGTAAFRRDPVQKQCASVRIRALSRGERIENVLPCVHNGGEFEVRRPQACSPAHLRISSGALT